MSSSDGDSDIHPDRIHAREKHYREDIQARSLSPAVRKGVDQTELDCVGAHLELSTKQESWPMIIGDLTDDEFVTQKPGLTSKSLEAPLHLRSRRDGSPSGSPTTRTCTPTACGQYLPPSENEELRRQRSTSLAYRPGLPSELSPPTNHPASIATTVEPATYDEEGHRQVYIAFSESHTPSHCSMGTVDGENHNVRDGPGLPRSSSEYHGTLEELVYEENWRYLHHPWSRRYARSDADRGGYDHQR